MSTGIGKGVAIPHGKCKAVDKLVGVLGIKKEGVDFQSLDEQPVYLFFLLVSPLNVSGPHIRALAHISRLLRHDNLRKRLIATKTPATPSRSSRKRKRTCSAVYVLRYRPLRSRRSIHTEK